MASEQKANGASTCNANQVFGEYSSIQKISTQTTNRKCQLKVDDWEKVDRCCSTGEYVYSHLFNCFGLDDGICWKFGVCPRPSYNSTLGFSLEVVSCPRPIDAKIQIHAILPGNKKDYLLESFHKFTSTNRIWQKTIENFSITSCIAQDGSLTIDCTLDCVRIQPAVPVLPNEIAATKDHPSVTTWVDLYQSKILSDFAVKVDDELIPCHRCILATRSPVFAALFNSSEMLEAKNGAIEIRDCSAKAVKAMLEFVYTRTATVSGEILVELLMLADKYQIVDMKVFAEGRLSKNIDTKTASDLLRVATLYRSEYLKDKVLNHCMVHWKDLSSSPEWKQLKESDPALAFSILENMMNKKL